MSGGHRVVSYRSRCLRDVYLSSSAVSKTIEELASGSCQNGTPFDLMSSVVDLSAASIFVSPLLSRNYTSAAMISAASRSWLSRSLFERNSKRPST
jgi:hypothetical protein